jgi:hypothetical protein
VRKTDICEYCVGGSPFNLLTLGRVFQCITPTQPSTDTWQRRTFKPRQSQQQHNTICYTLYDVQASTAMCVHGCTNLRSWRSQSRSPLLSGVESKEYRQKTLHSNLRFLADPASSVTGDPIDSSSGGSGCCDMRNANFELGLARFRLFGAGWLDDDIDGRADVDVSCGVGRVEATGMALADVRGGGLAEVADGSEGRGSVYEGRGGSFLADGRMPESRYASTSSMVAIALLLSGLVFLPLVVVGTISTVSVVGRSSSTARGWRPSLTGRRSSFSSFQCHLLKISCRAGSRSPSGTDNSWQLANLPEVFVR